MSALRQAVWGIFVGIFSAGLVFGGLLLAFAESGQLAALLPAEVPTAISALATSLPGQPTFTTVPTREPSQTPLPSQEPVCPLPPGWQVITILAGDTLTSVAQAYGLPVEILRNNNCLEGDDLPIGADLYVPLPTQTPTATFSFTATWLPSSTPHTPILRPTQTVCPGPPTWWVISIVRRGDTLYSIAYTYGITVQELMAANCLTSTNIITGQRLYVPNVPTRTPSPTVYIPPTATATWVATAVPSSTPIPTSTITSIPTHLPTPTEGRTEMPVPTPSEVPTATPLPGQ